MMNYRLIHNIFILFCISILCSCLMIRPGKAAAPIADVPNFTQLVDRLYQQDWPLYSRNLERDWNFTVFVSGPEGRHPQLSKFTRPFQTSDNFKIESIEFRSTSYSALWDQVLIYLDKSSCISPAKAQILFPGGEVGSQRDSGALDGYRRTYVIYKYDRVLQLLSPLDSHTCFDQGLIERRWLWLKWPRE